MTDRIIVFYGSKKDFEELVSRETNEEQVTIFNITTLDYVLTNQVCVKLLSLVI